MQLKQANKDTTSTRQRITTLNRTAFRQTSEKWNVNKRPMRPLTEKLITQYTEAISRFALKRKNETRYGQKKTFTFAFDKTLSKILLNKLYIQQKQPTSVFILALLSTKSATKNSQKPNQSRHLASQKSTLVISNSFFHLVQWPSGSTIESLKCTFFCRQWKYKQLHIRERCTISETTRKKLGNSIRFEEIIQSHIMDAIVNYLKVHPIAKKSRALDFRNVFQSSMLTHQKPTNPTVSVETTTTWIRLSKSPFFSSINHQDPIDNRYLLNHLQSFDGSVNWLSTFSTALKKHCNLFCLSTNYINDTTTTFADIIRKL